MRKASIERNRPLSGELYPRPLVDTYYHLFRKYPEESWDSISLRKQVCLCYIRWMVFPDQKENKDAMIDKVKAWRKEEPGRIGNKRSIIEKLCRKFFQEKRKEAEKKKNRKPEAREAQAKSAKIQMETGTAQHTPEMVNYRKTSEFGRWMGSHNGHITNACHWYVYPPEGGVLEVYNLNAFCRGKGLDHSHLQRTAKYPGLKHKGWRAEKRNMDLEEITKKKKRHNEGG